MDNKYFIVTKTIPGEVYFELSPIDNSEQHRIINLTEAAPTVRLPHNWALGIFLNPIAFKMFQRGLFTFNDVDAAVKAAYEEQVYFGEELDFAPVKVEINKEVLEALKSGKKNEIMKYLASDTDKSRVLTVAHDHINELTQGVISLLEKELGVQLIVDEA